LNWDSDQPPRRYEVRLARRSVRSLADLQLYYRLFEIGRSLVERLIVVARILGWRLRKVKFTASITSARNMPTFRK
jgi:hypothetical protein